MPRELRVIPQPDGDRVETGPVQFTGDWPGVFIRGDNALWLAFQIRQYLERLPKPENFHGEMIYGELDRHVKLLESCFVGKDGSDVASNDIGGE